MSIAKKGSAKTLVLSCIDPRFIDWTTAFLNTYKDVMNDYDLFILAGAELGALEDKTFMKVYKKHIDIAIQLHNITELWCISHMDCGYYKQHYEIKKDDDIDLHHHNQEKLKKKLKKMFPKLKYQSYIMDKQGEIHKSF
jgi:hypothetical protein